jgi:hypothetical protein
MNQFLKAIERWGEPVFVVLAFATLPVWFPLLATWVIIDPFYRVSVWKSQRLEASLKPSPPKNSQALDEHLAMPAE